MPPDLRRASSASPSGHARPVRPRYDRRAGAGRVHHHRRASRPSVSGRTGHPVGARLQRVSPQAAYVPAEGTASNATGRRCPRLFALDGGAVPLVRVALVRVLPPRPIGLLGQNPQRALDLLLVGHPALELAAADPLDADVELLPWRRLEVPGGLPPPPSPQRSSATAGRSGDGPPDPAARSRTRRYATGRDPLPHHGLRTAAVTLAGHRGFALHPGDMTAPGCSARLAGRPYTAKRVPDDLRNPL